MLSERQIQLLEYIIKEYISSSEPVGSIALVQKYELDFSAATVRNEMAALLREGFLEMLHSSSGRVPTSAAYKYFLNELMQEEDFPVLQEVALRQRLWPHRFEFHKLLRETVVTLADMTKQLTFATVDSGEVIPAGMSNMLENREFWDIDVARAALHLLDRYELLEQVFDKTPTEDGSVYCVIGEELGDANLALCCLLYSPFKTNKKAGTVCVLGPARMYYPSIIPTLRYTAGLIKEVSSF